MAKIAIFGCGDIGTRVAKSESDLGSSICAVVRSEAAKQSLEQRGLDCVQVDLDANLSALPAGAFDVLYYLVPPPSHGITDTRSRTAFTLLENTLVKHVVLISATGVYGDCNGERIDESHQLNPVAERSIRRVDAEAAWREWTSARGVTLSTLRVSGIYAQDRLPEKRIRAQTPVLAESESPFSNRIHADDLVSVCIAAAQRQFDGVINVADDEPTTMTDYFFRVADALGLPRPPEISRAEAERQFSAAMMSYLNESRRIDNRGMKTELGVTLRYPTLSEGLRGLKA